MTLKTYDEVMTGSRHLLRVENDYPYVAPRTDMHETSNQYVLIVEMPGVPREGFRLYLENDNLTVEGRTKLSVTGETLLNEIPKRNFRRVFRLGRHADPNRIDAKWEDGHLVIRIDKKETAKPHEIEITFNQP